MCAVASANTSNKIARLLCETLFRFYVPHKNDKLELVILFVYRILGRKGYMQITELSSKKGKEKLPAHQPKAQKNLLFLL